MAGRKGYQATGRLSRRDRARRGGNAPDDFPAGKPGSLARHAAASLVSLAGRNYTPDTIEGRRDSLKVFLLWSGDRELTSPAAITKPILESYQRHLWHWRKKNGHPLGVSTQRARLGTLKSYFAWLAKQNILAANPASELELPRQERHLPKQALGIRETRALLAVPNIHDPLGLRDRAILETLYSTGVRRSELVRLHAADLNPERQTLHVRQGKGHKDRVVPVGSRALEWLVRYLEEVRPRLLLDAQERHLFLTSYGEPFNPDVLSRMVSKWLKQADIGRPGSCHLVRHTTAVHLLEGGADIRFIQQLLGHEKLETTAIYTQVSIEQLKAVHARCHPAENPPGGADCGSV